MSELERRAAEVRAHFSRNKGRRPKVTTDQPRHTPNETDALIAAQSHPTQKREQTPHPEKTHQSERGPDEEAKTNPTNPHLLTEPARPEPPDTPPIEIGTTPPSTPPTDPPAPPQATQSHHLEDPEIVEPHPAETTPHESVGLVTKRIDGTSPHSPLTREMRLAIVKTYEEDLQLDYRGVANALGVGVGTVASVLRDSPAALERARTKRRQLIVDEVDAGLMGMAREFRSAVESGRLSLNDKNASQFGILFGIFTDKRQLMTGNATQRAEVIKGTFDEKKQAMLDVLEAAKETLDSLAK